MEVIMQTLNKKQVKKYVNSFENDDWLKMLNGFVESGFTFKISDKPNNNGLYDLVVENKKGEVIYDDELADWYIGELKKYE